MPYKTRCLIQLMDESVEIIKHQCLSIHMLDSDIGSFGITHPFQHYAAVLTLLTHASTQAPQRREANLLNFNMAGQQNR